MHFATPGFCQHFNLDGVPSQNCDFHCVEMIGASLDTVFVGTNLSGSDCDAVVQLGNLN